jgi:hypothetical protein
VLFSFTVLVEGITNVSSYTKLSSDVSKFFEKGFLPSILASSESEYSD